MDRKMELERRIELLQGEREGLSSTLDESADRIIMLEKQTREQDSIVRTALHYVSFSCFWSHLKCQKMCIRWLHDYLKD